MADRKTFDTPEDFLVWLDAQEIRVQRACELAIVKLIAKGVSAFDAAHVVYDVVEDGKASGKFPTPTRH